VEKTSAHKPLVVKMINYLNFPLVKVDHHGSMHSAPLDIYEIMTPKKALISRAPGRSPRWIKLDDDIDYLPTRQVSRFKYNAMPC
jgi:hypothetical protein